MELPQHVDTSVHCFCKLLDLENLIWIGEISIGLYFLNFELPILQYQQSQNYVREAHTQDHGRREVLMLAADHHDHQPDHRRGDAVHGGAHGHGLA